MTAYVLTANCNIDQLGQLSPSGSASARAGGDTVDTNGFTFTIDQDTRYGLTGGSTLSLGSMTINAAKGGMIDIDARTVRVIPYNTGSGNVPAYNTTVSQGGVTGKLIRVQSAINATPTAVGAAMPATGFITVKQVSGGAYAAGALTGIGASATGADVAGWIELVGDESATINCNRLGTLRSRGSFYLVGTTSGSAATTWQLPTNGSVQYYPGVQVETGTGTGVYEWYPCAGSLSAVGSTATDIRGKVCWITTGGVLRLGNDGTRDVGYVPPSGRNIRIPNILTAVCTTAARGTNALPNVTLATRYDFTTTGGGVIDLENINLAWYPSIAQAYSVVMTDVGILTQLSMTEVAQPMTLTRVCVGQEAANSQTALNMGLNFAGGTLTNCVWSRSALANVSISTLADISNFTFENNRLYTFTIKSNAGGAAFTITRGVNCTFNNTKIIGAKTVLIACTNVTFTTTSYADAPATATATTAVTNNSVWELATANSSGLKFDGLDFFGLTNVHPYLNVLFVNVAGCSNIKLRNIGTSPSSVLSLGSANQTAYLLNIINGAAASDVLMQRCFVSNTRTNLYTMDNSSTRITIENTMGDYADVPVATGLNLINKAVGATPTYAAQTGVYGTHWWDHFTSATVGRIAIVMNEPTSLTTSQVALTGGAAFTAAGGLYMPTIGMTATFTMPHFALGHSSFTNTALVMAGGGAVGNFTFAYQIDTGSGFSAWSSELTAAGLGTALNALSISPSTGFKLKLRITTGTTNTTAITSVYITTGTSAVNQANYFPLDTVTLTLTGLVAGSDVVVLQSGTETVRSSVDANAGTTWAYTYSTPETVDLCVYQPGYIPFFIRGYALGSTNASLPIAQVADVSYLT
jgi:hypothetical protein